MQVAETQAAMLRDAMHVDGPPVPDSVVTGFPRVEVVRRDPFVAAGATMWSHGRWTIVVKSSDSQQRQRFTLADEFKHVLDHPFVSVLYPGADGAPSHRRAEEMCNYFAASLLMPRGWVRECWRHGPQDTAVLARRFNVSSAAMRIRLSQVGITEGDHGRSN